MTTVKEEAEKFKEQAEKDWETILLARAKELAPGKSPLPALSLSRNATLSWQREG